MKNLSKQEIVDVAVNKFKQIKGHEACNEDVKSTITEIVKINENFAR